MKDNKYRLFSRNLLKWNRLLNRRSMPWKGEKDPYKVWLSEIILQQTRVEQGLDYYNNYINKYPTIKKLATAKDTDIYKLWEGLGYYNRCKNLISTARFIAEELDGIFPGDYESILKLKGIGPYTAAAIASFAFGLPYAVVDGNVMRVLSRYFGIAIPTDSTEGKVYFSSRANQLLAKHDPAAFNQAIMDFGATVCKPKNPDCTSCPMKNTCVAFQKNKTADYPVKGKKLLKTDRWLYYIVASYRDAFYIRKRNQKDIWQNLHEFILVESPAEIDDHSFASGAAFQKITGNNYRFVGISEMVKQVLTHQTIRGKFIRVSFSKKIQISGYTLVKKDNIHQLAFPGFIVRYLETENQHMLSPG